MPPAHDNQLPAQPAAVSTAVGANASPSSLPLHDLPVVTNTQPKAMAQPTEAAKQAGDEALLHRTIAQAKQVVAQTKDDPFIQVQELEKLKASYMQTRYGQNIKVADN